MRPHFFVHGRCKQQGDGVHGPGQAHQAEQIIGAAMQKFGHEVGTGGCHQDGMGIAGKVDVRHVVGLARIPLRHINRLIRQGLHRHWGDKLGRSFGHDHLHRCALFDQGAAQLCSFVASDTAA